MLNAHFTGLVKAIGTNTDIVYVSRSGQPELLIIEIGKGITFAKVTVSTESHPDIPFIFTTTYKALLWDGTIKTVRAMCNTPKLAVDFAIDELVDFLKDDVLFPHVAQIKQRTPVSA